MLQANDKFFTLDLADGPSALSFPSLFDSWSLSTTITSWLPSSSERTIQVGTILNKVIPKLIPMLTKWLALPSDCMLQNAVLSDVAQLVMNGHLRPSDSLT